MSKLSFLFESIYKTKGWGGNNTPFYSGIGSHDSNIVSPYIEVIKSFFKELKYKPNVIDIGCGDFNIGKELVPYVNKYMAVDIVDPLIEHNKTKYKDLNVNFKTLNITQESVPSTDIIIIKELFQHLSNKNILKALKNVYLKSKWLIITEAIPISNFVPNLDIQSQASFRPLINNSGVDILAPPFNFDIKEELLTLTVKSKGIIECLSKTSIYKTKTNE
tara:strand:+ start:314 stop:970 length:657 start_codon:yes stop_codon:yes gene_type:complete